MVLYHQLMVDSLSSNPAKLAGISLLIDTFRVYKNDRHLAAELSQMAGNVQLHPVVNRDDQRTASDRFGVQAVVARGDSFSNDRMQ